MKSHTKSSLRPQKGMTSHHDISRANSVQQKAYHLITTTHNGQKESRLIRISHQKTMQPNTTNVTRTSHNGKKPRHLLRKSPLVTQILQQKPCDDLMISSRHLISTEKAGNLSRNSRITAHTKHQISSDNYPAKRNTKS